MGGLSPPKERFKNRWMAGVIWPVSTSLRSGRMVKMNEHGLSNWLFLGQRRSCGRMILRVFCGCRCCTTTSVKRRSLSMKCENVFGLIRITRTASRFTKSSRRWLSLWSPLERRGTARSGKIARRLPRRFDPNFYAWFHPKYCCTYDSRHSFMYY